VIIIHFLAGLAFEGVGLAAYLQLRQGSDLPLGRHMKWLAAFGFVAGITSWIDMFLVSTAPQYYQMLTILRMIAHPLSGLLLFRFGWGIMRDIPLPAWTIFIPGVLIVPLAYVVTYAATTFITPSPLEIPIDIWSRYLLYLPGSIMAGVGFIRQWNLQKKKGLSDVANLLLGAGLAFLFEAFIVGLVVPVAPHGPTSYYNYDRVVYNAFSGENSGIAMFSGFTNWLDYERILAVTGLPIEFWRMLSTFAVTFFVVRGLGVFDAIRKRQLLELQEERDRAQRETITTQIAARQTAERWTEVLVNINRQIMTMEDVDKILLYIVGNARELLQSNFVGLALLKDEPDFLELKCYSVDGVTEIVEPPLRVDTPILLEILHRNRIYCSSGLEDPGQVKDITCERTPHAKGFGVVRLELDNRPIGILWATRSDELQCTETDLIWLECMADQVVIAIQHGLMTSQLQSLSITEERARIARDMHDGLAQVLGYLNLEVQTLEALHKQGKQGALSEELAKMRDAVRVANADVRENILSLRTTLAGEKGLISAIGEYLEEFGSQTGIETCFTNNVQDKFHLSSIAEVQLVCILQEALANVRKHAHARLVKVELSREVNGQEYISLQVQDDGIGLTQQPSKHSFGLKTMSERAASVGGVMDLHSAPGEGTTVTCRLPCLEAETGKKSQPVFHATVNTVDRGSENTQ
jgi:signal transduction histidine kinase